jgi:hypothetical protein
LVACGVASQWRAGAYGLEAAGSVAGGSAHGMTTHVLRGEGRADALVVVDPVRQAVAVYHIQPQTGAIELRSVRTIRWDLELSEYNSTNPLPDEIRKGLDRTR